MRQFYLILFIAFSVCNILTAQQETPYRDTLIVSGPNGLDLSEYITFWIDSSGTGTIDVAQKALKNNKFKHWEKGTVLNLGLNPYKTWLHLKVTNVSEEYHQYWWALYSQADAVSFYTNNNNHWQLHTEVNNQTLLKDRSIKTRFPVAEIHLKKGEHQQLLMKITNTRHTQNAITDFTTPQHNLLWEINFYWAIGFFIGCFFLVALLSILFSGVIKERAFLYYGLYLLCIVLLMLSEELMIPIIDSPLLFHSINRLHSLFLSLIALSLHYKILVYVIGRTKPKPNLIFKTSQLLNHIFSGIAILYTIIYFVGMESLHFGVGFFEFMWYSTIACIVLSMSNNFYIINYLMSKKNYFLYGIVLALLLLYFNPAGYFLNYSGIFTYYTITYPNYFYWIVCLEVLFFAIVLAIRYRRTIHNNLNLIKEKTEKEASAILREIEIQDSERRKIAQDLHDDLGTTISAVKLIITNQYASDTGLKHMITKANNDVRQFFTKLTVSDFNNEKVSHIIEQTIANLQRLNQIDFKLIVSGNESLIPDYLIKPLSRIAVELLLNTTKHSSATEATVQFIIDDEQVQLMVEDNGKGFDLQKPQKGMGITNIYSRTERWGGQVHFSSSQTGTTVIVIIPFKTQNPL